MTRDQALSKIKKCLALGKSQNPHEAAAAMRQAQKLMAEHAITEMDVSIADVSEASGPTVSQAVNKWETSLQHAVANAFGCEVYLSRESRAPGFYSSAPRRIAVFVGVGVAAQVAEYAYAVLSRQCAKARIAHVRKQPKNCKPITRTARGDEFALGWAIGVRNVLDAFANTEANQQLLLRYMEAKHSDMKQLNPLNRAVGRNVSNADFHNGLLSGRNAKLQRGVSNGAMKQEMLA